MPIAAFVAMLLLLGALAHFIPAVARPSLFFAVTVPREFRTTADARKILWQYRAVVWFSTLLAIVVALAARRSQSSLLVQAAGFVLGLADGHRRALKHRATTSSAVEFDLSAARQEKLPGGLIIALAPLLSLGVLAGWALSHPSSLAQQFPVNLGIYGVGHWVATTTHTVSVFLLYRALVCLLLAASAIGVAHWSRRVSLSGTAALSEHRFRYRFTQMMVGLEYLVAFSTWCALLIPSTSILKALGLALAAVFVTFVATVVVDGQGGSRAEGAALHLPQGDRTRDDCWKLGFLYVNPADPSVFVEKRFGFGYAPNFGHPWTWIGLTFILAFVVLKRLLH